MAKFCFVSLQQPGHMDFGGKSFIHLAQALNGRGHMVRWLFSTSEIFDFRERTQSELMNASIQNDDEHLYYLTIDHHNQDLIQSARSFSEKLKNQKYDCLVCDRLCVGAAFAAKWANIPWATIATDGREWSHIKKKSYSNPVLMPYASGKALLKYDDNESELINQNQLSNKSYWAISPYLNLTFFPRCYYENEFPNSIPVNSHFLGSGEYPKSCQKADKALITFGNTLNEKARSEVLEFSLEIFQKRRIPTLILTGSDEWTSRLNKQFSSWRNIKIQSWESYDEAYEKAVLVIGHGGTSHVWTGMRNGVPLFAIPSIGDQVFGAEQIIRLNIGRMIQPKQNKAVKNSFVSHIFKGKSLLDKKALQKDLTQLLDDEKVHLACQDIQTRMINGGGVDAGALLLEDLARTHLSIKKCIPGRCCC